MHGRGGLYCKMNKRICVALICFVFLVSILISCGTAQQNNTDTQPTISISTPSIAASLTVTGTQEAEQATTVPTLTTSSVPTATSVSTLTPTANPTETPSPTSTPASELLVIEKIQVICEWQGETTEDIPPNLLGQVCLPLDDGTILALSADINAQMWEYLITRIKTINDLSLDSDESMSFYLNLTEEEIVQKVIADNYKIEIPAFWREELILESGIGDAYSLTSVRRLQVDLNKPIRLIISDTFPADVYSHKEIMPTMPKSVVNANVYAWMFDTVDEQLTIAVYFPPWNGAFKASAELSVLFGLDIDLAMLRKFFELGGDEDWVIPLYSSEYIGTRGASAPRQRIPLRFIWIEQP